MVDKALTHGLARAVRKEIFSGDTVHYIKPEILAKLLLDELSERSTLFVNDKKKRPADYLWYITYEGRLGMVKKGDRACNAEKMLRQKKIVKDKDWGFYKATEVLNGCGCQEVAHRPYITALSKERWAEWVVDSLSEYLDGGKLLNYVIDTDFYSAYEPSYRESVYIDDLVTSSSCMSCRPDAAQAFYGAIEGCKVMRFLDADGDDVGRCIVYEYNGIRHFIRIYCKPEYQRDCLLTLRSQMREGDLFGRDEMIGDIDLGTSFDMDTPNMYLDGDHYGLDVVDGKIHIRTDYVFKGDSTSSGLLCDQDEELHCCHECGDWFQEDSDTYEHDGYYYCSDTCAEHNGMMSCSCCGECFWDDDDYVETEDGELFCCGSCARESGYVRTEDCEWIREEDAFTPNDGCDWYKDEKEAKACGWVKCAECGNWTQMTHDCVDGKPRCPGCLNNGGWVLKYVKESNDDEKDETSGD